ncbi:MAG TPA: RICIN domain-containing protein [Bryobacteraceae bacterium]|nr:RICIN domain-containing protein [Bryobacteraceae bacterium]
MTTSDGRQAYLNQAFIIDNAHGGLSNSTLYRIINRATGKALDVTNIDPTSGAPLQQYTYLGGSNQLMRFYAAQDFGRLASFVPTLGQLVTQTAP